MRKITILIIVSIFAITSTVAFEVKNNTDRSITAQAEGTGFAHWNFGTVAPKTFSNSWLAAESSLPATVQVNWENEANCVTPSPNVATQNYTHGCVRVDGSCANGFTITPNLPGCN